MVAKVNEVKTHNQILNEEGVVSGSGHWPHVDDKGWAFVQYLPSCQFPGIIAQELAECLGFIL